MGLNILCLPCKIIKIRTIVALSLEYPKLGKNSIKTVFRSYCADRVMTVSAQIYAFENTAQSKFSLPSPVLRAWIRQRQRAGARIENATFGQGRTVAWTQALDFVDKGLLRFLAANRRGGAFGGSRGFWNPKSVISNLRWFDQEVIVSYITE